MSLNVNKAILAGRLTADPELKATNNGTLCTSFTVAVDRDMAEKRTDFITVVAWKERAEFVTRYFSKGSPIYIEGTIQTRSWEDNYGKKRYATEIIADRIKFVESKSASSASATTPAPTQAQESPAPKFEELSEDDDLPF